MSRAQEMDGFVKVHMPGEWPWVFRLKEEGDLLIGRVDNHLVNTAEHGFKINDVVEFEWEGGCWEAKRRSGLKVVK